jgi:hypothetical protein
MTSGVHRQELRQAVDRATRAKLKLTAKTKPKAGQCRGTGYLGDRCMNTGSDGGYCYAHRETP